MSIQHIDYQSSTSRRLSEKDGEVVFAHYADAPSIVRGYVEGTTVEALCGKVFVPALDPEKLPLCPSCKVLADALFLF